MRKKPFYSKTFPCFDAVMIINNWYYILQPDTDTDLQFIHMVKMAEAYPYWGRFTHKQLEIHGKKNPGAYPAL